LWRETRDPAPKTAVNWATKTICRMTRRKAPERREKNNCEVTPQAIWPTANCLMKKDRPKASVATLGLSGLKFLRKDKANATCVTNAMKSG